MTRLTVHYDARCSLCTSSARWLAAQRQLIPLELRPKAADADELRVTADTGEYWQGDGAWLMVLWALDEYRDWAYRLAQPALRPLARQAFAALSANRRRLSSLMHLASDAELAARLREGEAPACGVLKGGA